MDLHKYQEIILDTGPLLQILVGLYNPKKLNKVGISEREFGFLMTFIKGFQKKLVTPHILAEISNLARNKKKLKEEFSELIEFSIKFLTELEERIIEKNEIIKEDNLKVLKDFGITDAAISLASTKKRIILTNDSPFFAYCHNKSIPVIHTESVFNRTF